MNLKWILRLAVAALVAVLVIALIVANRGRRGDRLRADSLEAVADTQRTVLGATVRRAVQAEIKRDELDKALKTKPKVVIRTVVEFRPIEGDSVPGTGVVEKDSLRVDSLKLRDAPVTLVLEAALPPAPGKGRFSYKLGIDPLPIIPMVKCSTQKFNGIYRATVAFDSLPEWAKVQIREAQADPGVCNPQTGFNLGFEVPWWTLLLASVGGIAIGIAVSP